MRFSMVIILLLWSCVFPASAQDFDLKSTLQFEDRAKNNSYQLEDGVLTITSRTGIGTVAVRPKDGKNWPTWTSVRFEYIKGGMKVLEGLTVKGAEATQRDQYNDLRPKLVDGALQINLPEELLAGTKYVEIHWVDFYRN